MNFSRNFIFLFCIILLLPLVASQPPFVGEFDEGFVIEIPEFTFGELGQPQVFHIHIYNKSNGIPITPTNSVVSCGFHLYDRNGNHLYTNNNIPNLSFEWEISISSPNFTYAGEYGNLVWCNSSVAGGFVRSTYNVRNSGNFNIFLVLALASVIILLLAFIFKNWAIGFLSGFLFVINGMYIMIYGLGGFADLYTQAIAGISIGIGIILTVAAGYDVLQKDDD